MVKAARHDANDGVLLFIHLDRLAEESGIASEALLPKSIADDGNLVCARLLFWRTKCASQCRTHAEHIKEVRGGMTTEHRLHISFGILN